MMKAKLRFYRIAVYGLVAFSGTTACSPPPEQASLPSQSEAVRAISVEAISLVPTPFRDRVKATGSLQADRDVTLSARAVGELIRLRPLGSRVARGEIVAAIDPALTLATQRRVEAAKKAAEADLALAQQTFERQRRLYKEGIISELEFQSLQARFIQAEAQLGQVEAQLSEVKEALSDTRVLAPFSGVVDQHLVEVGEQVAPQVPLVRVLDAATLVAKAGFPERYAADIAVGAEVELMLSSYGLSSRKGRVRFVATAIDPQSRTFEVEVAVDNADGRLKPEMVVTLVVTRSEVADALVIPESAMLRDEAGLHVFVVVPSSRGERATRKAVVPIGRGGSEVVVDGLSAGDRVITVGQTKVIDGDFVSVEQKG